MATSRFISGNPVKHNGGTIINAGNVGASSNENAVTPADNAYLGRAETKPSADANGVDPLISGRRFAGMAEGKYVASLIGDQIAGVADSTLKSGSSHYANTSLNYARGYNRKHITGYNLLTGAVTYGGNAGDNVTYIDPATGSAVAVEAAPTAAIPGEFVYNTGKPLPTQDDYEPRTVT